MYILTMIQDTMIHLKLCKIMLNRDFTNSSVLCRLLQNAKINPRKNFRNGDLLK